MFGFFSEADGFKTQIDRSMHTIITLCIPLACNLLREWPSWIRKFEWRANKEVVIKEVSLFLLITPWTAVSTGRPYASTLGKVEPENRCILVNEAGAARTGTLVRMPLCSVWCLCQLSGKDGEDYLEVTDGVRSLGWQRRERCCTAQKAPQWRRDRKGTGRGLWMEGASDPDEGILSF